VALLATALAGATVGFMVFVTRHSTALAPAPLPGMRIASPGAATVAMPAALADMPIVVLVATRFASPALAPIPVMVRVAVKKPFQILANPALPDAVARVPDVILVPDDSASLALASAPIMFWVAGRARGSFGKTRRCHGSQVPEGRQSIALSSRADSIASNAGGEDVLIR
jgi:hypothetical protein